MLMIAAIIVAGAALFVWFYIGRNRGPPGRPGEHDERLASVSLAESTPGAAATIGQIAKALSVFREGIVQANAAATEKQPSRRPDNVRPR